MTTATATPTTTTTTKAPRACWWEIAPYEMPDGRLMGYLGVRVGRVKDWYKAVRNTNDDMEQIWSVAKEQRDGSFAEAYTVRLPASKTATPVCSCPGWKHGGKCRHTGALTALTSK